MNSIKTFALVLALVGVASLSFAQAAGPKGGVKTGKAGQGQRGGGGAFRMGGKQMAEVEDKVLTKIGATADQKKKVVALRESQQKSMEALRNKYKDSMPKPGAGAPGQGQRPQMPAGFREDMQKIQK
ncbi:MAG: hypothetical protein ABUL72_01640, partial [Armatimonadota bacterium]